MKKSKHYYLIKTEEDCNVGTCGGTKDILELDCYTKDFVELTKDELECIVFVYGYHGEKGTEIDKIEKLLEIKGKW